VGATICFSHPQALNRSAPWSGTARHHIAEKTLQDAVKRAVPAATIVKPGSCHTFRHSFATQLLESSYDIRTVQGLLDHKNVRTTMIDMQVLNQGGKDARSRLDSM